MIQIDPDVGYEYPVFMSREMVNEWIFDVLGCENPVEISEVCYDESADGFAVMITVSSRDLAKLEMAGVEIEA